MATIYEVEVVSHWVNYPKEDLEDLLNKALAKVSMDEPPNEIEIKVKTRS